MPELSKRVSTLGTENAFVVLGEVEELVRKGKDIISFCIGQPDFVTPDNIREAGIHAIREGKTGYTPSAGIAPLREAVARILGGEHGLDVAPTDVVVAPGNKAFIGYTVMSVTDYGQGDEVIFPNPGYPIYESMIVAHGAVPVPLHLLEGRSFAFDPNDLARKITPKTKLIILNTPQNPTGGILTRKDLEAIAGDGAPDGHRGRMLQDVGDDRMADRVRDQPDPGAALHQVGHQLRGLRAAHEPVRGARGPRSSIRPARRQRPAVARWSAPLTGGAVSDRRLSCLPGNVRVGSFPPGPAVRT